MTYWPKFQPQLRAGIPTASVDCGVRSTQMAIDNATKGAKVPSVKRIREVGGMGTDPTNYYEWDVAVDKLGASQDVAGAKTNNIEEVVRHLRRGLGVVLAVHYGRLRRLAPAKTGSETFNGYHAIFLKGWRTEPNRTRMFDSLNDGRYRGCPKGPVWMPFSKLRDAATRIGDEQSMPGKVFALLVADRADIDGLDPTDPLPEPVPPEEWNDLYNILLDLREVADEVENLDLDHAITSLSANLGVDTDAEDEASINEGIILE